MILLQTTLQLVKVELQIVGAISVALLEVVSARIDFDMNKEFLGGRFMYITMIFVVVQYFKISSLDSLSTTELDIGRQSEALRVSPSQVLTSPSLFQQDLPGEF